MLKRFWSLFAALLICFAALPGNIPEAGGDNGCLPSYPPAIVEIEDPRVQEETDEPDRPSVVEEQEATGGHESIDN